MINLCSIWRLRTGCGARLFQSGHTLFAHRKPDRTGEACLASFPPQFWPQTLRQAAVNLQRSAEIRRCCHHLSDGPALTVTDTRVRRTSTPGPPSPPRREASAQLCFSVFHFHRWFEAVGLFREQFSSPRCFTRGVCPRSSVPGENEPTSARVNRVTFSNLTVQSQSDTSLLWPGYLAARIFKAYMMNLIN